MTDQNVLLRIIVENPPPDVRLAMQRGKEELLDPISVSAKQLVFEFSVRARNDQADGTPNFLGPFAQGPVGGRFVYVTSGTMAREPES